MTTDRYAVADDLGTLAGLADDLGTPIILGRLLRMYAHDLRGGTLDVAAVVTVLREMLATYPARVPCGTWTNTMQEQAAVLAMAVESLERLL